MDEVLYRLLAERIGGYLDAVDRLAAADEPGVLSALRGEVRRLTASWRALLTMHARSSRGGCAGCRRRRSGSFCTAWRIAHAYFVVHIPIPPRRRSR